MRESALFYWFEALNGKESIIAKITEITDRVGLSQGIESVEVELLGTGKARLVRISTARAARMAGA